MPPAKRVVMTSQKNPDVEYFLKENALEFTRKKQSITYLIFSVEDMRLVGYFTIAAKPVVIKTAGMSNTVKKKINRLSTFDEKTEGYTVAAYLIAQLGKNYSEKVKYPISGKILMNFALQVLQQIQHSLGGLIVYLECEEKEVLLKFYQEQNGFRRFGERVVESPGRGEPHKLLQLMNFL